MKARVSVLYREIEGCGDDYESNTADGVAATLTKWENLSGDWRVKEHYILEVTAINDHECSVHRIEYIEHPYCINADADMIRKAMKEFDTLVHAFMPSN